MNDKKKRDAESESLILDKLGHVQTTLDSIIRTLVRVTEFKDPYTAGHQRGVTRLACAVAREMGCDENMIAGLRIIASIHDIGKTAVPSDILNKPRALNEDEFAIIKTHPFVAYDILRELDFAWPVAAAVYQHHERLDGTGYPRGIAGADIIFEARLLAVADVVEAMVSHRPYRPAFSVELALEEISDHKVSLFDPSVVDSCLRLIREKNFRPESSA